MSGAMPSLLQYASWLGAQLKHGQLHLLPLLRKRYGVPVCTIIKASLSLSNGFSYTSYALSSQGR